MRATADPYFDPARPQAQRVWSRTWQTTVLLPEKLAAAAFDVGAAEPAAHAAQAAREPEAVVHLLAAMALRAGLRWQPTLARP